VVIEKKVNFLSKKCKKRLGNIHFPCFKCIIDVIKSDKLRFIGEIEFANWQRNGNGRLIASPTSNIYPITVGEDIILPQNVRKICDLWIDLHDKSKFV